MVGTGLFYRVRRDFARGGCGGRRPGTGAFGGGRRGAKPVEPACGGRAAPGSLPLRKSCKPRKLPSFSLSPSASTASPTSPAGGRPGRRPPAAAGGGQAGFARFGGSAAGPAARHTTLHRPLISTNQPRRAIMIYYPKGGALPCRITSIRRFTPPSAASRRGGSPPTARSPCWRAVRGLPASWAGRCTAIPPPASSPATVWCSGMAALHPALPSAGRGRSGRCWRPRASPFCRTAGWTCPAAGGKMRKKRCKGRIFL